jgi:hypothetical protein
MAYFKSNPPTIKELNQWNQNKFINPRTGRKIKENSVIFRTLTIFSRKSSENFKKNINNYNKKNLMNHNKLWEELTDEEDPVSLIKFWEMRNNKKEWLNEVNKEEVIIYQEDNLVRGFHYETILGFYQNKIKKHPISGKEIPETVFNQMKIICQNKNIILEKKDDLENLNDLALRTFQLFNNLSIFINYEDYCNLNSHKLRILSNELKAFYLENLSFEQKNQVNPLRKSVFTFTEYETSRRQILLDIKMLIENSNEQNKFLICYLILGGLVLVIPSLKETYPDLEFGFSL